VVEAHLAAIQKINPAVNAFCTVAAEETLVWAREAERAVNKRAKLKPLHGVPVAIKDLTPTAGIRTTFVWRRLPWTILRVATRSAARPACRQGCHRAFLNVAIKEAVTIAKEAADGGDVVGTTGR